MLDTRINGAAKERLDLVRQGRCGDIPVSGLTAQDTVADTAAYDVGFMTCLLQLMNNTAAAGGMVIRYVSQPKPVSKFFCISDMGHLLFEIFVHV